MYWRNQALASGHCGPKTRAAIPARDLGLVSRPELATALFEEIVATIGDGYEAWQTFLELASGSDLPVPEVARTTAVLMKR